MVGIGAPLVRRKTFLEKRRCRWARPSSANSQQAFTSGSQVERPRSKLQALRDGWPCLTLSALRLL